MTDTTLAFRFGHGLPLPAGAPLTPRDMMAGLRGPDAARAAFPAMGAAEIVPLLLVAREERMAARQDRESKAARKAERRAIKATQAPARAHMRAALARALDSPDGLRERLVAFWADHFTTRSRNRLDHAWPGALVEDAIRPHLTAPFATMLRAVTLHPGMLIYLDQVGSIGPKSQRGVRRGKGLNENLARELLELHTLGVGAGYGQADVTQMAELLTGLTVVPERGFAFDGARVEPGAETVLGVDYDGRGLAPIEAALDDLAQHPETARHIAGKLAAHFVADDPDPALVGALEAAWRDSGGDLGVVTEALLTHPAAWAPEPAKARQPFEFMVAALRGLGVTGARVLALEEEAFVRSIGGRLRDMGQPYQAAPGPDGWPEAAEAWINPQRLAARITWSMVAPAQLVDPLPDPLALAARVLGDRVDSRLLWAAERAESVREGVGLVLASPAFNRR